MEEQVLTLKQMGHLKELGCEINESSVYWARISHGWMELDNLRGSWFLSLQKEFMGVGFTSYEVVPTLTLQDILNRLPPLVYISSWRDGGTISIEGPGPVHTLTINRDKECYTIGYQFGNSYFGVSRGKTFIGAAYDALCELLKSGIIADEDKTIKKA